MCSNNIIYNILYNENIKYEEGREENYSMCIIDSRKYWRNIIIGSEVVVLILMVLMMVLQKVLFVIIIISDIIIIDIMCGINVLVWYSFIYWQYWQ